MKIVLVLAVLLAGCARTNFATEDHIALEHHFLQSRESVDAKAAEHCARFGRTAVPVSEDAWGEYTTVTYRCQP